MREPTANSTDRRLPNSHFLGGYPQYHGNRGRAQGPKTTQTHQNMIHSRTGEKETQNIIRRALCPGRVRSSLSLGPWLKTLFACSLFHSFGLWAFCLQATGFEPWALCFRLMAIARSWPPEEPRRQKRYPRPSLDRPVGPGEHLSNNFGTDFSRFAGHRRVIENY